MDTAVSAVTTDDVRAACHALAPVYAQTAGLDGCVSIEVDPRLSRDAAAAAGIDFDDVTEHLEHEGLAKFEKSWSELGATVAAELDRQQHDRTGR